MNLLDPVDVEEAVTTPEVFIVRNSLMLIPPLTSQEALGKYRLKLFT